MLKKTKQKQNMIIKFDHINEDVQCCFNIQNNFSKTAIKYKFG